MLTEEEFDQWCSQLRLAQNTRSLIAQIRQVPPEAQSTRELWQCLWELL